MLRFATLILPALIALSVVGCPKQQQQQAPPASEGRITMEERQQAEARVAEVPEDEREAIRTELMTQAPAFGVVYNASRDTLEGVAARPEGLLIDLAVKQIHEVAGTRGDMSNRAFISEAVRQYYELLAVKSVEAEADRPELSPEARAAQEAQERAGQEYLRVAESVIGDWRSIREQREGEETLLLEHTDSYYKLLLLPYESTKVTLTEWKDGSETSKIEYQYTYDKDTGELTTLLPDGSSGPSWIIKYRLSEPDNLYVKPSGEFIYTVYNRIGYGGRPLTEAEQAARSALVGGGPER